MDLKKIKEDRFKFLHKVYEAVQGRIGYTLDGWEVGRVLGFEKDYSTSIYYYLKDEGLVEPMGAGIRLGITHWGIKEVEAALEMPDKPTEHFLPIANFIHVETMSGGAIQQGTNHSIINQTVSGSSLNELRAFIETLKEELPKLNLSKEQREEIEADIQTIEQQSKSPKPKTEIIKYGLLSIKTVVEGAIAGIAANIVTPTTQHLIETAKNLIAGMS